MVTVYSKPNCAQCDMTKRALKQHNIPFTEVDVSTDAAARSKVDAMGYRQVPVVETSTGHWGGFRPDQIAALKA